MPLQQPQAIRTVFFDAGFTLLHPYPSSSELCQKVCQQLGLHIHIDKFNMRMAEADEYYFRQTRLKRYAWASEQTINEFWIEYYMELLRPLIEEHSEPLLYELAHRITREFEEHTSWQVYSDVLPVLKTLKAHNYTLGVISDWGIGLGSILRQHHLTGYFDCLLVSAVTRQAKPSPALYELALQRADSIADYTIHIGDSYVHDILGARAVGITPILLDRLCRLEESNVDCLMVHSLHGLLELLEITEQEK